MTPPDTGVLIAGCGYVGVALAERLAREGHLVWGLRRRPPPGTDSPIHWLSADLCDRQALEACLPQEVGSVVYCASSGERTEQAYERAYVRGLQTLLLALQGRNTKRILFTSSTAVYAQTAGQWVNEQSPTEPAHFSGRRTLEAEALVAGCGLRGTVLRCSGIYGPGRGRLVEQIRRGDRPRSSAERFTNRIHRDDLVGAALHVLNMAAPPSCLVVSDNEPATSETIARFIASCLKTKLHLHDDGSGLRANNKRCDNALLRRLGYTLQYPTFREGYAPLCTPA